jgi:hypothetical protein
MDDEFMKILEEELKQQQEQINKRPIEDFDHLSPEDMFNLVHRPFQEGCPIQYKQNIHQSILDRIPFLNLAEYLLNKIETSNSIKLTPKGNLPTKLVKELYDLKLIKEEMIESGISKLYKESDSLSISNVKIILTLSGLIKKMHGKIKLTKKGKTLLQVENREELFKAIFEHYAFKFNLGYHDLYEDSGQVQSCLSYTLFQLLKNGSKERNISFYSDKMIRAYPHILTVFKDRSYSTPSEQFKNCYRVRFMERFLNWFDFIESSSKNRFEDSLIKPRLVDQIFEIRNENFKFKKEKFFA